MMDMENSACLALVTVRLIRSFEYQNITNVIYKDVDLNQKVSDFMNFISKDILTNSKVLPRIRTHNFDTMKINHKAFGGKSVNPLMSSTNDEALILKLDLSLKDCGVGNETELSFFSFGDYEKWKKCPDRKW